MRNFWIKYKWPMLVLINSLPFALNVLFYKNGAWNDLLFFLPIFVGLTVLNFINCNKTLGFIVMQVYILVCIVCSGFASTYLYYHNVSNDSLTPAIGQLFVILEVATNMAVTTVTAIVKAIRNKKQTSNING